MKKIRSSLNLFACAGLLTLSGLLAGPSAIAQQMDSGTDKMMKSPDMKFAMKASQGGMAEVQMGQLAAQKGNSPDVKAFGQQMVDDHTKANDQLKQVAQSENMTLPMTLNAKDQAEYNKLQGLSGNAFDREYVNDMVKDHEMDVKEFEKEANSGADPQIKNFASQTLPVLHEHLKKIRGIQSMKPADVADQH